MEVLMKRLAAVVIIFLLILTAAQGHPAGRMELRYDKTSETLRISVKHTVKDETTHYLDKIIVTVNKEEVVVHSLKKQNSAEGLELSYYLPGLKAGDKITVSAKCNKFGTKKESIRVQ